MTDPNGVDLTDRFQLLASRYCVCSTYLQISRQLYVESDNHDSSRLRGLRQPNTSENLDRKQQIKFQTYGGHNQKYES